MATAGYGAPSLNVKKLNATINVRDSKDSTNTTKMPTLNLPGFPTGQADRSFSGFKQMKDIMSANAPNLKKVRSEAVHGTQN